MTTSRKPVIRNHTRPDLNPRLIAAEFWEAAHDDGPVMVLLLDAACKMHMGILLEKAQIHLNRAEGNCVHICRDSEAIEKWAVK